MHLIESNMKRIFITYANERFALSEKLIIKEAKSLGIFDECIGYTPKDLPDYVKANPLMAYARGEGGGYWCWKPYIMWKTLQDHPDAVVVYADAGCKLQPGSEWDEWFRYMETYDTIVFQYKRGFDYGWGRKFPNHKVDVDIALWSKKALLDYYDQFISNKDWHKIPSLMSGLVIAKRNSKVAEEWYLCSLFHPELFLDAFGAEAYVQDESFIVHRHDQSALTAIMCLGEEKNWNIKVLQEVAESRTDAAVVATRRIIKPVRFKTKVVNMIKAILGEKLYRKLHPKK